MSGFSIDWLNLREPLDAASRADDLARTIAAKIRGENAGEVSIMDLGCGTGANLRHLAPLIGGSQSWLMVDGDPSLLDAVAVRAGTDEVHLRTMKCDLAKEMDLLVFPPRGLVTASALLDLVSSDWLEALAERCVRAVAPVLFALTYDGRIECNPPDPTDDKVRQLVNAHQRTDKGFGPALGPNAARSARRIFESHGYKIEAATSDWRIGKSLHALQRALIDGWFTAASEMDRESETELRLWLDRRHKWIGEGKSELVVGHVDMIGWPRTARQGGSV